MTPTVPRTGKADLIRQRSGDREFGARHLPWPDPPAGFVATVGEGGDPDGIGGTHILAPRRGFDRFGTFGEAEPSTITGLYPGVLYRTVAVIAPLGEPSTVPTAPAEVGVSDVAETFAERRAAGLAGYRPGTLELWAPVGADLTLDRDRIEQIRPFGEVWLTPFGVGDDAFDIEPLTTPRLAEVGALWGPRGWVGPDAWAPSVGPYDGPAGATDFRLVVGRSGGGQIPRVPAAPVVRLRPLSGLPAPYGVPESGFQGTPDEYPRTWQPA